MEFSPDHIIYALPPKNRTPNTTEMRGSDHQQGVTIDNP